MKQEYKLYTYAIINHIVVIGALIGFLTAITAIILYVLADPTFSFLTHWVSHLGVGPNGSDVVFNGGMIYSGIISWIYSLFLAGYLHKKGAFKILVVISLGCGIILGIGLLMLGIFPLELIFGIHNVAAGLFFYGGMFSCIVYGITAYLTPGISKLQSIIGFMIASIFLAYIVINTLPIHVSFKMAAEWCVFFAIPTWILSQGILVLRSNYT
ncbi:MAG: DUF998 domain-containing protein [Candidatus Lokiarchaeota archaeon]|nr:DUF998 domain-containing protein [Candidatus Lokiarchaeota archaeon]